jgi:DNA-directed RNA polymerase subunit RPC12/RpoP
MPQDKYYCGNCGATLYFGRKFREHTALTPCEKCQTPNPVYFKYCYTCGHQMERDSAPPSIG